MRRNFSEEIGKKEVRKQIARQRSDQSVWFGFGAMGMIGWSVALPTLLGVLAGAWLDAHYPGKQSWVLALLIAGVVVGCWNAWHWVSKEDRAIHKKKESPDE